MSDTRKDSALKLGAIFGALALAFLSSKFISQDAPIVLLYIWGFGTSAIYLVSNREKIIDVIRAWPSSFVFTVVVFYLSKLLAEKTINSDMGIEAEYIKQASIIGGFIISVPLSLVFASLVLFARCAHQQFVAPVVETIRRVRASEGVEDEGTEIKEKEFFPGFRSMFACCVLILASLLLSQADKGIRYAVMLDSMKYSDCGPAVTNRGYVRKNANACYQFDTRFVKGSSIPVEISSKKP